MTRPRSGADCMRRCSAASPGCYANATWRQRRQLSARLIGAGVAALLLVAAAGVASGLALLVVRPSPEPAADQAFADLPTSSPTQSPTPATAPTAAALTVVPTAAAPTALPTA